MESELQVNGKMRKPFPTSVIDYFLHLFSLPHVREEVAKYARIFKGEATRFTTGMKGEAVETRDSFIILSKYLKKEKLTGVEKKQFKKQTINMLKCAGVVVPVMLIPLPFVSTLLLILMDHLLLSLNIRILPDSFYQKERKEVLTRQGVLRELKRKAFGKRD